MANLEPERFDLGESRWNDLLDAILGRGLDAEQLSRHHFDEDWANWDGLYPTIVWEPSGGDIYLQVTEVIDRGGGSSWGVRFRPGLKYPTDTVIDANWGQVLHLAAEWAHLVQSDRDAEPRWAGLAGGPAPAEGAAADSPLQATEQEEWAARLDALEERVEALEDLSEARKGEVAAELAEIRVEITTNNRRSVERSVLGLFAKLMLWGVEPGEIWKYIEPFLAGVKEMPKLLGGGD